MSKSSRLKQLDRTPMVPVQPEHAFTLIELLVVLAMVTLLAMTLLPALAKAKYPSMVSNCTANYKQWVQMAAVYASDDPQGCMPSFKTTFSAGNPTDVATNFLSNLVPYGMTIAMNFCPVRQEDLDKANAWFYVYGIPSHRDIRSVSELNQWFTSPKGDATVGYGRSNNGGYAKLLHLWWVPRETSLAGRGPATPDGGSLFPWPNWGAIQNAPVGALSWPLKTSDTSVSQQPIISDYAESGSGSQDIGTLKPPVAGQIGWGHFFNGSLQSLNVGFADGHVETHNRIAIQWQFTGNIGAQSYFY